MHIFIDESGSFAIPRERKPAGNCVGAVIIRDAALNAVLQDFAALSKNWVRTKHGEIKGRLLDENQFYDTIEMLAVHDVLFDCAAIDLGLHLSDEIEAHKEIQAQKLEAALTPEHQPEMIADVKRIAAELRAVSLPSYIQNIVQTELVQAVLRSKVLYFAQVYPSELGHFSWRIDAKDDAKTGAEKLWETLVHPTLEARSIREPDVHLIGADYSHYERFMTDLPKDRPRHSERSDDRGTDLKLLLNEDRKFEDSKNLLGLQIADVLTSIVGRAMRGNIRARAWWHLGKLMVRPLGPHEAIRLLRLNEHSRRWKEPEPFERLILRLRETARDVLVEKSSSTETV